MSFVEEGGTAVYVQGVGKVLPTGRIESCPIADGAFYGPSRSRSRPLDLHSPSSSQSSDLCGPAHRRHDARHYENVWATQTLRDLDAEPIVASIGFKWFSEDHKLHYSGPGESWWGADLAIVPKGQGRIVVSQLRIVENLGKDPVADKILYNLIEFSADR